MKTPTALSKINLKQIAQNSNKIKRNKDKKMPHLNSQQRKKFLIRIAPKERKICFTPSVAKLSKLKRNMEASFVTPNHMRNQLSLSPNVSMNQTMVNINSNPCSIFPASDSDLAKKLIKKDIFKPRPLCTSIKWSDKESSKNNLGGISTIENIKSIYNNSQNKFKFRKYISPLRIQKLNSPSIKNKIFSNTNLKIANQKLSNA